MNPDEASYEKSFHKERMQVILRRLRGILLFPFLEKVGVFA